MSRVGNGPGWVVRAACPGDLDVLAAIVAADPAASWDRRTIAGELEIAWSHVDLLVDASPPSGATPILGLAVFWHVADELQLNYIATHPEHRRRGVARRLLEHMAAQARALEASRITLEVGAHNVAARALYESMHFEVVGRRAGYYKQGDEDALLMTWSST